MSGESRNELARLLDAANADRRYLRARAEKAEADLSETERMRRNASRQVMQQMRRAEASEAELLRLRDGIQALADEYERIWKAPYHLIAAAFVVEALRGLLSPTPEGPTT